MMNEKMTEKDNEQQAKTEEKNKISWAAATKYRRLAWNYSKCRLDRMMDSFLLSR